jgi:hypothetical protein
VEYPSTKNLYESNKINGPEHERGPQYGFSSSAFGQISSWLVTEKVDGMNMRVVFANDPTGDEAVYEHTVSIYGRTDRANIPGDLMAHMREKFTTNALIDVFRGSISTPEGEQHLVDLPEQVVLFGEGFGPGIQKAGQAYGGEKRFILFDVVVDGHWLKWDDVEDVARKLGIPTVPVLSPGPVSLEWAKCLVHSSALQDPESGHVEGIVARTDPYLFDGRGNRVMFKYKIRDLPKGA